MKMSTEHSENYDAILESIMHPEINFIGAAPPSSEREGVIKDILHDFINHQYLKHDLTEDEAEDLHQYINERSYRNA